MSGPSLTLLNWLLAATPIVVVFILMIGRSWGGSRAGPVGWLVALMVGALVFKGGPELLGLAQLRAVLLTVYVLYIIWMALLLFRIVEASGAIQVIGEGVVRLTANRMLQLLILAWVFSSFLQGVAGFGVPVAVVAPVLIGLGFAPTTAVASTAIGHSWSVTFGDIASSFNALIATSTLDGMYLAPWSAIFLGVACLGCGLAVAHVLDRWRGIHRGLLAIALIGGSMVATQYVLATNGLWNLAGFVAGIVGLLVSAAVTRLPFYRASTEAEREEVSNAVLDGGAHDMPLGIAMFPYLVLIVLVTLAELWSPLHQFLNQVQVEVQFPRTVTQLGWETPAAPGKAISVFGHAGALLAYTSIVTLVVFFATGNLKRTNLRPIFQGMARSAVPSSLGIASMIGMAVMMDACGMTTVLARGLSVATGALFPLLSPFIGLLGAFMTGSNTNSNAVFAPLQKSTANLLNLSAAVILGAQTTGGALGSMLAPAKVIVGCSTADLVGEEGKVMRITVAYGILITALIGALAWMATL